MRRTPVPQHRPTVRRTQYHSSTLLARRHASVVVADVEGNIVAILVHSILQVSRKIWLV